MHKYLIIAALGCFSTVLPNQSCAQKDQWTKGFVITSGSDSVTGYLLDQPDRKLAGEVSFSTEDDRVPDALYTPADIDKFCYSYGRTFEKFFTSSFIPADSVESVFFAKKILTGKIDLYVLRIKGNINDILLRNNSSNKMVRLTQPQKTTYINEQGDEAILKDKNYLGLLTIVKTDSAQPVILSPEDLRYSVKEIKKNIAKYNEGFATKYPAREYTERKRISYEISGGINLLDKKIGYDYNSFRVSGYRNRTNTEKNPNLTFIQGITFNYSTEKDSSDRYHGESYEYTQFFINLIPIGVKLQTKPGWITGYAYFGIGAGMMIEIDKTYKEDDLSGTTKDFIPLPLAVIGLGTKIKAGPVGILAEVVPAYNGIFINLGLNFLEHIKK